MTTTTGQSVGIYRIDVAGEGEPTSLTRKDGESHDVTILPRSAQTPGQEWIITWLEDGNAVIQHPWLIQPMYLTNEGDPKKPEEGDQIVYHGDPVPQNLWQIVGRVIRFSGSNLGIKVAPRIFPPLLELGVEDQLEWVFVRLRDV